MRWQQGRQLRFLCQGRLCFLTGGEFSAPEHLWRRDQCDRGARPAASALCCRDSDGDGLRATSPSTNWRGRSLAGPHRPLVPDALLGRALLLVDQGAKLITMASDKRLSKLFDKRFRNALVTACLLGTVLGLLGTSMAWSHGVALVATAVTGAIAGTLTLHTSLFDELRLPRRRATRTRARG